MKKVIQIFLLPGHWKYILDRICSNPLTALIWEVISIDDALKYGMCSPRYSLEINFKMSVRSFLRNSIMSSLDV